MRDAAIESGDFVWLMGSLCQLNRIPFDAALLRSRFAAPHTVRQVMEAAQALGFRVGEHEPGREGLRSLRFPCIGFLKGQPAADDGLRRRTPAILFKADAERVLYFTADQKSPQSMPAGSAGERLEPYMLLARHESGHQGIAPDGAGDAGATPVERFGFGWFATELLRHRTVWRDVLLGSLCIQLIGLATPLLTQVVIDKVVVHQTTTTLVAVALALAIFVIFNAGLTWLRQYLVLHTGSRVDAVLGSQVFRHLLRLHLSYFEARPTGVLTARLHAVETIREFIAGAAVSLLLDLPFLVIFLAVMFWYSWQLTLITLVLLAAVAATSAAVTPMLRALINRQFLLGARNQAFLTEHIVGMETVKSLQMEHRLESRYDDYLAASIAAGFETRRLSNTYGVVANALEQAMLLAVLCAGALLVMKNDGFTVGMLVAFQMFAGRLSQPMMRLAGLWQEFQQADIAVRRLGDVMNAPTEPQSLVPSRRVEGKGAIDIHGLVFRYSPGHPHLFRNLNLSLEPGKLHVIEGPSGAGKSTLAKLLLGFYQPDEGRILLDGRDLRHLAANELRANFGVVPQETVLFSGSVYENLIAADPHAGFDDVVAACRIAGIHEVIERLPDGYQTALGEHGVGLSGGQKQRLAIARAMLKRPKVLVFDEATSALDPETAERFAATVNDLKGKATILFISHHWPATLEPDSVQRIDPPQASAR